MKRKQEFPTLFDRVRASTFVKEQNIGFYKSDVLRQKIFDARRFTLSDEMSTMLGDLANAGFQGKTFPLRNRAVEAMRMGARLPHRITWIEYNLRKAMESARKYKSPSPDGGPKSKLDEIPFQEGWLMEQHPQIETAFRATLFTHHESDDDKGYNTWQFPWAYCWVTDDAVLPYRLPDIATSGEFPWARLEFSSTPTTGSRRGLSALIVGLVGYHSDKVGVEVPDSLIQNTSESQQLAIANLLMEWSGTMRRMWALLSTINDLPTTMREVKPSKGYMAGRNYRKFLAYKTITLTVPQTEYVKIARSAVAKARRRAHQVRGHWRRNFRKPGERIWIHEHQRGDASLGLVIHNYDVKTEAEKPKQDQGTTTS